MQRNVLGAAALACLLGGCGGVTQVPQFGASPAPTQAPTANPTSSSAGATPTPVPTNPPTNPPTNSPTQSPTNSPTQSPTNSPTQAPTNSPTQSPTAPPTASPAPTASPTATPKPTSTPKSTPAPTASPTASPTAKPSPTATPTSLPTGGPASGSFPGSALPPGVLNPNVPPGTNFDMSIWSLQLPTGSGTSPTTIINTALAAGYTSTYFQTDTTSGALDFYTPEANGCIHTSGSTSCRSELREVTPAGVDAAWPDTGSNTLSGDLVVTKVAGDPKGVVFGQIHFASAVSSKPLIELFYGAKGDINAGVEQSLGGGNEKLTSLGTVPVGTRFTYVIDLSNNVLTVTINGKATKIPNPFASNLTYYFKAGAYGQGTAPGDNVSFYGINVVHK
jgi:hypothetical protein